MKTRKSSREKSIERLAIRAVRRLFRAVGLRYSAEKHRRPGRWQTCTWTAEKQADFRVWLTDELRAAGFSKQRAELEAATFLLNYGWKTR